ncbi:Putative F0F1-ATPase subunit Ca2+/Mg2+ transporter [Nonlabens sp. Hel1_33_55]|uniref:AtpZ/AtpI family protein n=1 Tax=Nonlabens sp. Hel1_33_55 TaxID=1336802 RepID=UPI000875B158|nr:AtpZ/AtpI family protein [Nonlabens sp. Hel1_33_55]SCY34547.1 Putative F0F1-ATPase subunit Ca2+/Mg2+ transporter [Nonlabens sp. Hel1_33_55]
MASRENPLRAYAIFSGIAIQMLAIIGGLAWLGTWLDDRYGYDKLFTAIGVLLGVGLSLYVVLIQLKRINKYEDNSK